MSYCNKAARGRDFFQGVDTSCFENYQLPDILLADHYTSKLSFRSTSKNPLDIVVSYGASDLFVEGALVCDGEVLAVKKAGLFFDRSERDMKEGGLTTLSIKLEPGKTYHLYAHIKKHFSHFRADLNVDLRLFPIEFWHQREERKKLFQGLYLGLMGMLAIFVLFFFFNHPKPDYFFYLCYITTSILGFVILENIGGNLFFPENRFMREQIAWMPLLGLCSFYILFIRYYINTPRFAPIWDRIASFVIGIGFVLAIVIFLFPMDKYPSISLFFGSITVLITLYAASGGIVFFISAPSRLRLYLMLGTSLLFLGYVFQGANLQFGWIRFEVMFIPFLVMLLESLLFAMGLAHKMRLREDQKKSAENQRLLAQQEKENLAELNRLKSRFFANISHEFRTPLSLILGPLNEFKQKQVWPEIREMGMMQRNAERLLQLIDQMLDLSKEEAAQTKLSLQSLDFVDFLKRHLEIFQSSAASKNINYTSNLPKNPIWLDFDPDKLAKIVTNLLSNAFKFTPSDGQVAVSLESKIKGEKGISFLVLIVKDSGIGIPLEEQEQIFERFYQVQGAANASQAGTGIGLSLAQDFAQLHGGYIEVQSREGEGAAFLLHLPIKTPLIAIEEKEHMILVSPHVSKADLPMETTDRTELADLPLILLVEDNRDMQQFINRRLEGQYRLITAFDGKEGLSKAIEQVPDLIISDIMMPEMDGLGLSKALAENALTSHIPLILLTARVGQAEKIKGLETGAVEYLAKPFDPKELLIRIHNLTQKTIAMRERFSKQVVQLEPEDVRVSSVDERFLKQLTSFLDEQLDNPNLTVVQIASALALSRVQVHRKMKALTGLAISDFLRIYRLKRAKQLIIKAYGNMSEIAYKTGFSSPAQFSKNFKKTFGISPTQFAKKQINRNN